MRGPSRALWTILILSLLGAPACPSGSDPRKAKAVHRARYVDNGDGIYGAGDTIEVRFRGLVDVLGGTPDSEFLLPVAGDTFGTGATFQGTLPLLRVETVVIVLGADPVIQANGTYEPDDLASGFPSGIDVSSTQTQIFVTGKTKLIQPRSPPGRDIEGDQNVGRWNVVGGLMTEPRRSHTATLLPNGEVLIVGGMNDQSTGPNPGFSDTLDSIEIFDPASGTFALASGSLVHPRARHDAVRTPGPDGIIDTNDDYVVIIGGWNSMVVENNGPRSEGSVEVIWPDPDGDGDTSDLVVNWNPGGPPWTPAGVAPSNLLTRTIPGIGAPPGCADVDITVGMEACTFSWVPDSRLFGFGNNELISVGGYVATVWDDCNQVLATYPIFTVDPPCTDIRPFIAVDADNDGDLFDFWPGYEGCLVAGVGYGMPWTTPQAFTRWAYSQNRIPGSDGLPGTADDGFITYGGEGFDLQEVCASPLPGYCISILGNLEYLDWIRLASLPNHNDAYSSCGLICKRPGKPTDRMDHVAVVLPGPAQEIALIGGWSTGNAVRGTPCASVAEIVTPDFPDPMLSTIRFSGTDRIEGRVRGHVAGALSTSGNAIVAGGYDDGTGSATASAAYLRVAFDRFDPVADMSVPRMDAASVTISGVPEDRVYLFGGWDASQVTLSTAEYFTE